MNNQELIMSLPNQSDEENLRLKEITRQADEWFSNVAHYGENPEIFRYQTITIDKLRIMRLHFYEGCKLFLVFNSDDSFEQA